MRRRLVAANWKMNGRRDEVNALLNGILSTEGISCERVICPPNLYMAQAQQLLEGSGIGLGCQNIYTGDKGAFTGEISAAMLSDFSCEYVIVGHSERRELFAENDRLVADKFAAAQAGGLTPILCVGESLEQREAGQTDKVVLRQLDAVISLNGIESFNSAVIAYEPVWAIGTGLTATGDQAQAVHSLIRNRLADGDQAVADSIRLLYGGSVKAANAAELFAENDIDGALVGGASLNADEFNAICSAD